MRGLRAVTAVTATGAALAALAGCADQTETYCAEVEDRRDELTELALSSQDPGPGLYPGLLGIWRDLQEEAPDDIADEWATLVFSMEGFLEAVARTGATPETFDPERPPPGATDAEVAAARDAAEELVSTRVFTAAESVQQHARDVCRTDLGLTGRPGP